MNEPSKSKILMMSHGHPDLSKGGAEIAAYNLYKEYLVRGLDCYFLARTDLVPHFGAYFSSRSDDGREILLHTSMTDFFLFSKIKDVQIWGRLEELLKRINPDVIHLHHYIFFGIEIIKLIRSTLPKCRIILTLHEYLAICNNNGQMLKTNGKLCYDSNSRDCHSCFPEKSPGDFFLRKRYLMNSFKRVDHFVSPSKFLKDRYIDWGIDRELITVIENGQPKPVKICNTMGNQKSRSDTPQVLKLAFFGQVNPYKGVDVLLKAMDILPRKVKKKVVLDIHGANLDSQSQKFKTSITHLLEHSKCNINFCGSYEPREMPLLLKSAQCVIVPSIWWENSPMVIQEAFNYDVPLIVSDIGGMAEKVKNGVNGLHFRTGKPHSLAEMITLISENPEILEGLKGNITQPISSSECAEMHLRLY